MSFEMATVLNHLESCNEPIDAPALARACDCADDMGALNRFLHGAVLQRRVKRHHNSDGILRYSLVSRHAQPPLGSTSASQPTLERTAPSTPGAVKVGALQAKMLNALSDTPMSAPDLAVRGGFTSKQASNLLQLLRSKGLAEKHMAAGQSTWSRVQGAPHPAVSASKEPPATASKKATAPERKRDFLAAAENAQRVLQGLEFSHRVAKDALDLYVASVVNPLIFTALTKAVTETRAALDAFVEPGRKAAESAQPRRAAP
jgi:hypothetical protein